MKTRTLASALFALAAFAPSARAVGGVDQGRGGNYLFLPPDFHTEQNKPPRFPEPIFPSNPP